MSPEGGFPIEMIAHPLARLQVLYTSSPPGNRLWHAFGIMRVSTDAKSMLSVTVLATGLSNKGLKAVLTTHAALAVPAVSVGHAAKTAKTFCTTKERSCLMV